jgi:hypothetical protein
MGDALRDFTARLGEAKRGTGEGLQAMLDLGISEEQIAAASPTEMLDEVWSRVRSIQDQATRVSIVDELFSGPEMIQFFDISEQRFAALRREMQATGQFFSQHQANMVTQSRRAQESMMKSFGVFGQQLTIAAAPYITAFSNMVTNASKQTSDGVSSHLEALMSSAQSLLDPIAAVADAIGVVFRTIKWFVLGVMTEVARFRKSIIEDNAQIGESMLKITEAVAGFFFSNAKTREKIVGSLRSSVEQMKVEAAAAKGFFDSLAEARTEAFENIIPAEGESFLDKVQQFKTEVENAKAATIDVDVDLPGLETFDPMQDKLDSLAGAAKNFSTNLPTGKQMRSAFQALSGVGISDLSPFNVLNKAADTPAERQRDTMINRLDEIAQNTAGPTIAVAG